MKKKIIVGISGASGAIYGITALRVLRELKVETHLIISNAGKLTIEHETNYSFNAVTRMADIYYNNKDIAAMIASGSVKTLGMLIAPCSAKTLSEIAYGGSNSLMSRTADVTLKERRKLVLMFREAPIHLGHIKSMMHATENGAIIMPPLPAFYTNPTSIDEMVMTTIARALDLFDLDVKKVKRWKGL